MASSKVIRMEDQPHNQNRLKALKAVIVKATPDMAKEVITLADAAAKEPDAFKITELKQPQDVVGEQESEINLDSEIVPVKKKKTRRTKAQMKAANAKTSN